MDWYPGNYYIQPHYSTPSLSQGTRLPPSPSVEPQARLRPSVQ
jgi:hypothetical protein